MRPYPTPWDHDLNKVDSTLPNVFCTKGLAILVIRVLRSVLKIFLYLFLSNNSTPIVTQPFTTPWILIWANVNLLYIKMLQNNIYLFYLVHWLLKTFLKIFLFEFFLGLPEPPTWLYFHRNLNPCLAQCYFCDFKRFSLFIGKNRPLNVAKPYPWGSWFITNLNLRYLRMRLHSGKSILSK